MVAMDEDPRTIVPVAICGDWVVGQALALLLGPYGYEARLVPLEDLDDPGRLGNAGVVVLAPTPSLSSVRRETLVSMLRKGAVVAGIPVLELTELPGRTRVRPTPEKVPWPCSTEELERRIEVALCSDY
jgi:hypothetical protein